MALPLQQLHLPSSPQSPQIPYRSTSDSQVKEGKAEAPMWRSSPVEQNLLPRNLIWHTDSSFETTEEKRMARATLSHGGAQGTTTDHKQLPANGSEGRLHDHFSGRGQTMLRRDTPRCWTPRAGTLLEDTREDVGHGSRVRATQTVASTWQGNVGKE